MLVVRVVVVRVLVVRVLVVTIPRLNYNSAVLKTCCFRIANGVYTTRSCVKRCCVFFRRQGSMSRSTVTLPYIRVDRAEKHRSVSESRRVEEVFRPLQLASQPVPISLALVTIQYIRLNVQI